jgi:hypothetical protein
MVVGFTTIFASSAYHHLKMWVWIPLMARCTQKSIIWNFVENGVSIITLTPLLLSRANHHSNANSLRILCIYLWFLTLHSRKVNFKTPKHINMLIHVCKLLLALMATVTRGLYVCIYKYYVFPSPKHIPHNRFGSLFSTARPCM